MWHWLQKPAHVWTTWVANRVSAIKEVSDRLNIHWRHCPGVWNPADLPSRGGRPSRILDEWQNGPVWIVNKERWPRPCTAPPNDDVLDTMRIHVLSTSAKLSEYPWWTRLSTWTRLIGLGARMLSWRRKDISRWNLEEDAEYLLYKIVQESLFTEDLIPSTRQSIVSII